MVDLVEYIIKHFTEFPDKLSVTSEESDNTVTIVVRAAAEDMGKIIGKQGKIAKAIRTIVKVAGAKESKKYFVEIKDKE